MELYGYNETVKSLQKYIEFKRIGIGHQAANKCE